MKRGDKHYIWQYTHWPHWQFDLVAIISTLGEVQHAQGHLHGLLANADVALRDESSLIALTQEVLKTSEIEGEQLNADSVRSSIARRLGLDVGTLAAVDRNVEGVVDMVLDATANYAAPLTEARLFGWHTALFPTGYSGLFPIKVGTWRDDSSGAMQVVSGAFGRQKVHFEAPPADKLNAEMTLFLNWFNSPTPDRHQPPLVAAGLAHL